MLYPTELRDHIVKIDKRWRGDKSFRLRVLDAHLL